MGVGVVGVSSDPAVLAVGVGDTVGSNLPWYSLAANSLLKMGASFDVSIP